MSVAALAGRTAQLREVELGPPSRVIGTTTTTALQSGVVYGIASLVEGLIARIRGELGVDAPIVATGRHAGLIHACSDLFDVVDESLTIEGLRLIWTLNRKERSG
jgi:type III pantothenate kinase